MAYNGRKAADSIERHQDDADDEDGFIRFPVQVEVLRRQKKDAVVEKRYDVFVEKIYEKIIEIGFGFFRDFFYPDHENKAEEPHDSGEDAEEHQAEKVSSDRVSAERIGKNMMNGIHAVAPG
jgi:hypothetical protein